MRLDVRLKWFLTGSLIVLGTAAIAFGAWRGWRRWGWWRFMVSETTAGAGEAQGVKMDCRLQVDERSMTVEARVTNGGVHDVYLFDFGKGAAKICLGYLDDAHALHLVTGVPPMPHFPTYWLFHPDETKLRPGEAKDLLVVAQLPILEGSIYYGTEDPISGPVGFGDPAEVRRVVYEVDFIRSDAPGFNTEPVPRGPLERVTCELNLTQAIPVEPRSDEGFETQRRGREPDDPIWRQR